MNLYINFNKTSQNLGGSDPEDRWSRDSYQYYWGFLGLTTTENNYPINVENYDPQKTVYVVYVIYSTGDSFGYDTDCCCEEICGTHDLELAKKVKKYILEDKNEKVNFKKMHNVDGIKFMTYPWKGYFESLSYVAIKGFNMVTGDIENI
jgi:hypothetical protein